MWQSFRSQKNLYLKKIGIFFPLKKQGIWEKKISFFLWGCHNAKIPPSKNNPTDQYNLLSLFKTLSEFKVLWLAHVPKVMLKRREKRIFCSQKTTDFASMLPCLAWWQRGLWLLSILICSSKPHQTIIQSRNTRLISWSTT